MVLTQVTVAGMDFLTSVYSGSWPIAFQALDQTSNYELFRLLDQIHRDDLATLLTNAATPAARSTNLERILYAAETVLKRRSPATVPSTMLGSSDA